MQRKKSTQQRRQPHMGVSTNRGTPKSSILIGFSIINHPFWGTPLFGNTHILQKTPEESKKCATKKAESSGFGKDFGTMKSGGNPQKLWSQESGNVLNPGIIKLGKL